MKRFFKEKVYFISAARTPFGSFLGSLQGLSATDLGVISSKRAIIEAKIPVTAIEHVIFGNVLQTAKDAIYLARHVGLKSEIPQSVPAVTINRLCGSGFEAIVQAANLIALGQANCVLAGGAENMSQAPHIIRGARTGLKLGANPMEDYLWASLTDPYVDMPMAITAENLAEEYGISQYEVDEFSYKSQQKYFAAVEKRAFSAEITPVEVFNKKQRVLFAKDEHPKESTTLEAISALPKVFKKDGVIHAAAASGICDGAASLILCNEATLEKFGLTPLGELVSFGVSGCDPRVMGIGPVPAIKQCLERANVQLEDVNMVEVNEAFAPQVLAVKKELKIPEEKLNIHGGALAIGHPLAASGARITAHLLHTLSKKPKQLGMGSACIGGGQGISVLVSS